MRVNARIIAESGALVSIAVLASCTTVLYAGTNAQLQQIPANEWVRFHVEQEASWDRQPHAGAVYDSKRGTILLFGSETHGYNSDNSVREFDPATASWTEHYPPSAVSTYRADSQGRCIAGTADAVTPPAMHTYDALVYDPVRDAMIVGSTPAHNPDVTGLSCDYRNTWLYDHATRRWSILDNGGVTPPTAFARAMAYDAVRETTVLYASRVIGELPSRSDTWLTSASTYQGEIHYMLECIATDGKCYLFGDYLNSDEIRVYTPAATPGNAGTWETRAPSGDAIPADQTFPVAYDSHQHAFLLVMQRNGVTETYVYDPIADDITLMPSSGDFQTEAMNYMMVYDEMNRVFLAVTGSWQSPTTVWAYRLERPSPPVLPFEYISNGTVSCAGDSDGTGTQDTALWLQNPNAGARLRIDAIRVYDGDGNLAFDSDVDGFVTGFETRLPPRGMTSARLSELVSRGSGAWTRGPGLIEIDWTTKSTTMTTPLAVDAHRVINDAGGVPVGERSLPCAAVPRL